ncbi:MAG TPA: hypothetical protein VHX59_14510 [Mycobacteriales bacterium]|jgi:hypothetical protein|nr:hypothetical protein [Mycobacteriales bacterium]
MRKRRNRAQLNELTGEARMHALLDEQQVGRGWARRGHGYQPGRLGHEIKLALRRLA